MKAGDLIKVLRNTNTHNYIIGEIYEIIRNNGTDAIVARSKNGLFTGNNLKSSDIKLVYQSVASLKKEKENLLKNLMLIDNKIKYMETNDIDGDKFNDDAFLSWSMINILNSDDTEKEKKLTSIINSISTNVDINILKNIY